ncbi:MAG: hypothetical protein CMI02_05655 [Oceanospirillaceae bacterium]|nr:hypothetical protein [Oceanospirillaceae bacterium]MBT11504.1 hypothetical protein [Oceanospirillaceae bacterium]|tara:strand:+ start:38780 stop:39691 length:912 start_codon:yes stop_codon:yes gene_type:complete
MEIEVTHWNAHREILDAIRRRVFINEQKVPEALEWDADDADAVHFIAHDGQRATGCARLLPNGHFGRMAVLREYRNQGVGKALLRAIESHYQKEFRGTVLRANAQTHAWRFYHDQGFVPQPAFNMDAGIPHVEMSKDLARNANLPVTFIPGKDNQRYQLDAPGAAEGFIQVVSSYGPTSINLCIADPALPVWSDNTTLSCFTRYLRSARQRSMRIILAEEYPGIADHPLIQLQQRVSSRIGLKVYSDIKESLAIMPAYSWVKISRTDVKACVNDRPGVARLNEQFEDWWKLAQNARESRRLRL